MSKDILEGGAKKRKPDAVPEAGEMSACDTAKFKADANVSVAASAAKAKKNKPAEPAPTEDTKGV